MILTVQADITLPATRRWYLWQSELQTGILNIFKMIFTRWRVKLPDANRQFHWSFI